MGCFSFPQSREGWMQSNPKRSWRKPAPVHTTCTEHDDNPKQITKTMLELFQDKSLNVFQVAQPKPRLKLHRTSVERPENGSSQLPMISQQNMSGNGTYSFSHRRPLVPVGQVQVLWGLQVPPCWQGGTQGIVTAKDIHTHLQWDMVKNEDKISKYVKNLTKT